MKACNHGSLIHKEASCLGVELRYQAWRLPCLPSWRLFGWGMRGFGLNWIRWLKSSPELPLGIWWIITKFKPNQTTFIFYIFKGSPLCFWNQFFKQIRSRVEGPMKKRKIKIVWLGLNFVWCQKETFDDDFSPLVRLGPKTLSKSSPFTGVKMAEDFWLKVIKSCWHWKIVCH